MRPLPLVIVAAAVAVGILIAVCIYPAPAHAPTGAPATETRGAEAQEAPPTRDRAGSREGLVEVSVVGIRMTSSGEEAVVLLREGDEGRFLPIWVGQFEARAIAISLYNMEVRRPLPYDLLRSTISSLGAKLGSVVVNDVARGVFYATLVLDVDGRRVEIDSRPSDAIALALRADAPIYVAASVLDRAGVELEWDPDGYSRGSLPTL